MSKRSFFKNDVYAKKSVAMPCPNCGDEISVAHNLNALSYGNDNGLYMHECDQCTNRFAYRLLLSVAVTTYLITPHETKENIGERE